MTLVIVVVLVSEGCCLTFVFLFIFYCLVFSWYFLCVFIAFCPCVFSSLLLACVCSTWITPYLPAVWLLSQMFCLSWLSGLPWLAPVVACCLLSLLYSWFPLVTDVLSHFILDLPGSPLHDSLCLQLGFLSKLCPCGLLLHVFDMYMDVLLFLPQSEDICSINPHTCVVLLNYTLVMLYQAHYSNKSVIFLSIIYFPDN